MHLDLRQKLTAALLAFGPFGILLVALLDSFVIPLPAGVDVLVLTIAVNSAAASEPQRAYLAALMAVIGSSIGNVALFWAARHGSRKLIKDTAPSPRAQKFQQWFH